MKNAVAALVGAALAVVFLPATALAAGGWNQVPSQNSSTSLDNTLQGSTCVATFDCWAVGYQGTASGHTSTTQTLIEHRTATGWVIVSSPNSGTATDSNALIGVTCVTATDCWAVGYGGSSGTQQTLAEHWNGSSWSIVSTPDGTNGGTATANQLYGVTCVASNDCWAVGEMLNGSGYYDMLIEHWDGTSWTISPAPANPTGEDNLLFGVACTSSTNCFAVGYVCDGTQTNTSDCATSNGSEEVLIEGWNGTSWALAAQGQGAESALQGISCSATECWAVGFTTATSTTEPLIEHWDGGSGWTLAPGNVPAAAGGGSLYGVACDGAQNCAAVGYQGSQTLVMEHSGAASNPWTISPSDSTGASDILYGVGCDPTYNCAAVGQYSGNAFQTLVLENVQPSTNVPELPAAALAPFAGLVVLGGWKLRDRRRRRPAA